MCYGGLTLWPGIGLLSMMRSLGLDRVLSTKWDFKSQDSVEKTSNVSPRGSKVLFGSQHRFCKVVGDEANPAKI